MFNYLINVLLFNRKKLYYQYNLTIVIIVNPIISWLLFTSIFMNYTFSAKFVSTIFLENFFDIILFKSFILTSKNDEIKSDFEILLIMFNTI